MNKSNIEACQLEQQNNSEQTAQNQQVSQPNANTNVVGSLVGQREIKFKFWLGHIKKMTYEHNLIEIAHMFWDFNEEIIPLQYTGLKDKNGQEIYEGDWIKMTNKRTTWYGIKEFVGTVEFDNSLQYIVRHKSDWIDLANPDYDIKVIGNIFENPELLQTFR